MLNTISAILNNGVSAAVGDYESIQTVTVGAGGQASVTFSSIPSTYTHLQLRGIYKDSATSGLMNTSLTMNNVVASGNYAWHYLQGDGSAASAGSLTSTSYLLCGQQLGGSSAFGVSVIDILDYTSTNKNKTTRTLTGHDENGSGTILLTSGVFLSTNAITVLTLKTQNNFTQYSQFALYGVK